MTATNDDRSVRLWFDETNHPHLTFTARRREYIARPRADDDAREERLKRAEEQRDALAQECSETEHVAREAGCDESIRHFPVALHDLLTRLTDERDEATRDRDEWRRRAEAAEAELARLACEKERIPSAVGSMGENRDAGVEPAAAPVDSLPTDAALRRCVAGPATVSSDTARAGVSS